MKLKNSLFALMVLLLLGGALYYVKFNEEKKLTADEESKKIFNAQADKIFSLNIQNPSGKVFLKRFVSADPKKPDEKIWTILEPLKADAESSFIAGIASSISELNSERSIDAKKEELPEYGLDKPDLSIEVGFRTDDGREKNLKLAFGIKNPADDRQYITLDDSTKVRLTGTSLDYLKDKTLNDFRKKAVFNFSESDVGKISISYPMNREKFAIEKRDKGYFMTEPISTKADEAEISKFISNLSGIKAMDFPVEDYSSDPAKWGFAKPYAEIKVNIAGRGEETLMIGNESPGKKGIYVAKQSAKNVAEVAYNNKELLTLKLSKAVDKALVGWTSENLKTIFINSPTSHTVELEMTDSGWVLPKIRDIANQTVAANLFTRLKNYRADEFISERINADLAKAYGFDKSAPLFLTFIGKNNLPIGKLMFGKTSADGKIYAVGGPSDFIFKASKTTFDQLKTDIGNIRNRKLIQTAKEKIDSIVFSNHDGRVELVKDDKGVWKGRKEGKLPYEAGRPDLGADAEKLVAYLTQDTVVGYIDRYDAGTKDTAFGFDKFTAKMVVKANKGAEKIIIIGAKDETGSNYFLKHSDGIPVYRVKADGADEIIKMFTAVTSSKKGE